MHYLGFFSNSVILACWIALNPTIPTTVEWQWNQNSLLLQSEREHKILCHDCKIQPSVTQKKKKKRESWLKLLIIKSFSQQSKIWHPTTFSGMCNRMLKSGYWVQQLKCTLGIKVNPPQKKNVLMQLLIHWTDDLTRRVASWCKL